MGHNNFVLSFWAAMVKRLRSIALKNVTSYRQISQDFCLQQDLHRFICARTETIIYSLLNKNLVFDAESQPKIELFCLHKISRFFRD